MSSELLSAIEKRKEEFGVELSAGASESLAAFYALVMEHNEFLHLVGPCSPEEFATRHILESLTLLKHLPEGSRFADVGSGAGLPAIPCLIARPDLKAVLIESKKKKADFLQSAVESLGLADRAEVVNKQFTEVGDLQVSIVCCRAIDRFSYVLPKMMKWASWRAMLLFGGPALQEALERSKRSFAIELMPLSEQRYLFIIDRPR